MDLQAFREYLLTEIKATALEESIHQDKVFIDYVADILINDYSKINTEIDSDCFVAQTSGNKAFKSMQLDAANLDLVTNTLNLMICDYNENEMTQLNTEFINTKAQRMLAFCENCLKGYYNEKAEEAQPIVQLARNFVSNASAISKIKMFLISTNELGNRIKTTEQPPFIFQGKAFSVDYEIADINTIFNSKLPTFEKEDIEIDVKKYNAVIPCLKAQIETEVYESYLAIVPGKFLAEIYNDFGSRLLEDNVRSFLNVRGTVNKGIRGTILNEKDRFFTYNNGISTTAKEIIVENVAGKGLCITSFKGLQIINGGQTTASLANAMIKDKADLSGIYVQMKLTITKDSDPELVRLIAKYANSQNKVTGTDLNSNHPFYKRIEDYSTGAQRIMAPMQSGSTYQTIWFFERARGQYDQPKMQMTKAEREKYERINPKNQKFNKTELAKYINTAELLPHIVSWGGEVNAIKFQELMEKQWEKDNTVFNDNYFRALIAKAILFKHVEKLISNEEWYKENKGYRAQLVPYTIAKFIYSISTTGKYMNYRVIWDRQAVPECFDADLKVIAKQIFDLIYDIDRPYMNIGEYCKREICWKNAKEIQFNISKETMEYMLDDSDIKEAERQSKKSRILSNEVMIEVEIFNLGYDFWQSLKQRGDEQKVLNYHESQMLELASNYCLFEKVKQISSKQAKEIGEIKNKLEECGIK